VHVCIDYYIIIMTPNRPYRDPTAHVFVLLPAVPFLNTTKQCVKGIVMRTALLTTVLGAGLFLAPIAYAQTATVTATCKDGTDFSGTTRSGACKGHKGVASWGTAAAATAAPGNPGMAPAAAPPSHSANAAPTAPPPSMPSKTATNTAGSSNTAGKMGGPGQVWVNTSSKVYHCPGDRYYGKTKAGEFMSQAAAEAAGDHPSGGKACSG
jgi:hypothetical protein